jgi:hypothetical protein
MHLKAGRQNSSAAFGVLPDNGGRPRPLPQVLLSPAGFHQHVALTFRVCAYLLPMVTRLVDWLWPGRGFGLRLPTPLLRYLTFKLSVVSPAFLPACACLPD